MSGRGAERPRGPVLAKADSLPVVNCLTGHAVFVELAQVLEASRYVFQRNGDARRIGARDPSQSKSRHRLPSFGLVGAVTFRAWNDRGGCYHFAAALVLANHRH